MLTTHSFHDKNLGESHTAALAVFRTAVPEQEEIATSGVLVPQLVAGDQTGVIVLDPESGSANLGGSDLATLCFEHAIGKRNGDKEISVMCADHRGNPRSAVRLVSKQKNGSRFNHTVSRATVSPDALLKFAQMQPNQDAFAKVLFFSNGATLSAYSTGDVVRSTQHWYETGVSHVFLAESALRKWMGSIITVEDVMCAQERSTTPLMVLRAALRDTCTNEPMNNIPTIHVMRGQWAEATPLSAQRIFVQQLLGFPAPIADNVVDVSIVADDIVYSSEGTISSDRTTLRLQVHANKKTRALVVYAGTAVVNGSDDVTDRDEDWSIVPLNIPGLQHVGVHDESLPVTEALLRLIDCPPVPKTNSVDDDETLEAAAARLISSPVHAHGVWASTWTSLCANSKRWQIDGKSEWLNMFRCLLGELSLKTSMHRTPPSMLRHSSVPQGGGEEGVFSM